MSEVAGGAAPRVRHAPPGNKHESESKVESKPDSLRIRSGGGAAFAAS